VTLKPGSNVTGVTFDPGFKVTVARATSPISHRWFEFSIVEFTVVYHQGLYRKPAKNLGSSLNFFLLKRPEGVLYQ